MSIVKVNRTGRSYGIYDTNAMTNRIGTLYNNEVFVWTGEWPGSSASGYYVQSICFRGSDGTIKRGWVGGEQSDPLFATNICSLANFTRVINGVTYYGFRMRRDEELYDRDGNILIRNAAQHKRILCASSTGGDRHPEWLSVVYLESGIGTGNFEEIVSGSNAFVDIGFDTASMFDSDCSLIGSL